MAPKAVMVQDLTESAAQVLSIEEIANLPPEKRKDYGRLAVHEFLRNHPEGVVVDQVAESIGLGRKTVYSHLEVLCALRKAYRREWGPRRIVYYPMDAQADARPDSTIDVDGRLFTFQEVENQFGKFLYLQERSKDLSGAVTTKGGILVPRRGVREVAKKLGEYAEG